MVPCVLIHPPSDKIVVNPGQSLEPLYYFQGFEDNRGKVGVPGQGLANYLNLGVTRVPWAHRHHCCGAAMFLLSEAMLFSNQ